MSDNRKRDIFYGVVAVATLIVALIGATLAYFSISVNSAPNAVTGTAATISIEYEEGKQIAQGSEIIPASWDVVSKIYEYHSGLGNIGSEGSAVANICKDSNDKEVCSIYRFSIHSNGDSDYNVYATLNNEFNGFEDLYYAVRDVVGNTWIELDDQKSKYLPISTCDDGTNEAVSDCVTTEETGKTYNFKNSLFGKTLEGNETKFKTLPIDGTKKTYDVILFILDDNTEQNINQGAQFFGTVFVDVTEGSTIKGYIKPGDFE